MPGLRGEEAETMAARKSRGNRRSYLIQLDNGSWAVVSGATGLAEKLTAKQLADVRPLLKARRDAGKEIAKQLKKLGIDDIGVLWIVDEWP
jgi:hypothetical protein